MDDADNNEGYPQDQSGALVEGKEKRKTELEQAKYGQKKAILSETTCKKKQKM